MVLEDVKIIYDLLKELRESIKDGKESSEEKKNRFRLANSLIEKVLVRFSLEWRTLVKVRPLKFYEKADAIFSKYDNIIIDTIMETRNIVGDNVICELENLDCEMKDQANRLHTIGPDVLKLYIENGNKILEHAKKIEYIVVNPDFNQFRIIRDPKKIDEELKDYKNSH